MLFFIYVLCCEFEHLELCLKARTACLCFSVWEPERVMSCVPYLGYSRILVLHATVAKQLLCQDNWLHPNSDLSDLYLH
jgi:hypothetical protein